MTSRVNTFDSNFDRKSFNTIRDFSRMGEAFGDASRSNLSNMQKNLHRDMGRKRDVFDRNFAATQNNLDHNFARNQNAFAQRVNTFDRDFADAANTANQQTKIIVKVASSHYRGVAIGTGVPAIGALVALIALAIIFAPVTLGFILGVSLTAAAFLALGITAIVYGARAVQVDQAAKAALHLTSPQ